MGEPTFDRLFSISGRKQDVLDTTDNSTPFGFQNMKNLGEQNQG